MDKYEYNVKADQIKKLANKQDFATAAKVADTIDWRRVKNAAMLTLVADIYEENQQYEEARNILQIAYERSPLGRQLAYRLTLLCLKTKDYDYAEDYFNDFIEMSPLDIGQYILKYHIGKEKGSSTESLIETLENYIEKDMDEKWAYKLAELYHEAGYRQKCIDLCDEIILWFSDGKYVEKAMELKMQYTSLTPNQQAKYERRQVPETIEDKEEESATFEDFAPTDADDYADTGELDIEKIKVKQVSVGLYDTMNIQAELAKSMEIIMKQTWRGENEPAATDKKSGMTVPMDPLFDMEFDGQLNFTIDKPEEQQIDGQMTLEEILAMYEARETEECNAVSEESTIESLQSEDEPVEEQEKEAKEVQPEQPAEDSQEKSDVEEIREEDDSEVDFQLDLEESDFLKAMDEFEMDEEEAEEEAEASLGEPEVEQAAVEKHYLPEEYRKNFEQFLETEGLEEQIANVITYLSEGYDQDGTSHTNNIRVMGEAKSGKTTIVIEIIKIVNRLRNRPGRRIAKITGAALNKLGLKNGMSRLMGTDLIIEQAGSINPATWNELMSVMDGYTGEMIVVLEDDKIALRRLEELYPELPERFNQMIQIKSFDINEWVEIAKEYALEKDYTIDDMGGLALYAKVDMLFGKKQDIEMEDIRSLIDAAILKSEKKNITKIFDIVFSRKYKESDLSTLREADFI